LQAKQREAKKGLNYLRRANLGEKPCLRRILFLAYGRMGRRRRALLEDLLKPVASVDEESPPPAASTPAPLHTLYYTNTRCLQFFDAPQKAKARGKRGEEKVTFQFSDGHPRLKAVLTSQAHAGVTLGAELKRTTASMDTYNVWGRTMPIRRARNYVRKFYADIMAKVLPPLPNEEWDQLAALARGEVRWAGLVARRTRATTPKFSSLDEAMHPNAAVIERGLALEKPSKADRPAGNQRPHNITSRTMRRLYAHILSYCCKLEWNEQWGKWEVVWPKVGSALSTVYSRPTEEALFAGVDSQGKRPGRGREARR
jgi:hypothetical protein